MAALPVAERELRLAARRPRTYYLRLVMAGLAFLIVAYATFALEVFGAGATGGRSLFGGFCWLAAWTCLLGGVAVTADAISQERREGTLGLLFLSHLSGLDVVLGKLAAAATYAFGGLLAVVPVLAIPVLAGGVQPGEFLFEMLALANTLFFSLCLGLLTSSRSRDPRQAKNAAVGLALLFWLGPRAGAALAAFWGWPPEWIAVIGFASPASTHVFTNAMPVAGGFPSTPLLATHLLAWLFLTLAAACTRRAWRERPAGTARSRIRDRWRDWTLGPPARRAARRAAMLDRNPFYWLAARRRFQPLWPLLLVVLVGGAGLGLWLHNPETFFVFGCALAALHVLLKFWIASEAVTPLVTHRREGTLELLLSTPLSVRDIMRGQFLSARRQFLLPLVLASALTLFAGIGAGDPVEPNLVMLAIALIIALFADAFTLVWLGTWKAIASRRVRHAAGNTILQVLFAPWFVLFFLGFGAAVSGGPEVFVGMWFLVGMISDFIWWQWARQRLLEEFRDRAERAASANPPGWLDRLDARRTGA